MSKRFFFTEIGNMFSHVIDAIAYYLVNTPLSKFVVRTLLLGGVAALTLGPIGALLYYVVTGNPLDTISIPIGVALISLALLVYFIDKTVAKHQKPDIFVEPIGSFFEPNRPPSYSRDPKYLDGNGFSITAHVRIKAGNTDIRVIKAELWGYTGGLSLFATTYSYRLWSKKVNFSNSAAINIENNICQRHSIDGNYNFQPPIHITAGSYVELSVERQFHGPFQGEGAPIDFGFADLTLPVHYDADSKTKWADFYFACDYQVNGLVSIPEITKIDYFSDREIAFWSTRRVISARQRDVLIKIEQEVRLRIIKSRESEEALLNRWHDENVTYESIAILRDLSKKYCDLPRYDPNFIWNTWYGRMAHWLVGRLRSTN